MKRLLIVMGLLVAGAGCKKGANGPAAYTQESSDAYIAAWKKRQAGDEAGWLADLKKIAEAHPATRAGVLAKQILEQPKAPPAAAPGSGSAGAPTSTGTAP